MGDFDEKVVVVTGAGSGIGAAIAQRLGQEGCRVVVSDVHGPHGASVVRSIVEAGGRASFKAADVSKPEQVEALVAYACETYGGLYGMVNNAGISGAQAPTAEYPLDSWDAVIGINLSGVFYGCKYALPALLAGGGGAIVNIASILGAVGFPNAVAYVAAKHGVVGLTKSAAIEYGAQGVRVNAVGPAFIHTPLLDAALDKAIQDAALAPLHPIGRLGEAPEVAELVAWLLSDKASFVTGSYYPIDGGYLSR